MSTKIQALAKALNVPGEHISSEGSSGLKFLYQDRVYMVASWAEAVKEFRKMLLNNVWDFDLDFITNYITLPVHIDKAEFLDSLVEMATDMQALANPLILAYIKDIDDFVDHVVENYYGNNLGEVFSPLNKTQGYIEVFDLYFYRVS